MKTNILKVIQAGIVILVLATCTSCAQHENRSDFFKEKVALKETGETPNLSSYQIEENEYEGNTHNSNLKIIQNANCKMKVNSIEQATFLAKKIATQHGGYISEEQFTNTNFEKENQFTIRIPQDRFELVLDSMCSYAEFVDYKNISAVDVTEEYVDITSRLKTKLEIKERYTKILRNRAKTVEDILMAEDKLRQLQEEIESAQGRLNHLGNKLVYSTIIFNIYEKVVPAATPEPYEPSYLDKAADGFSLGWILVKNVTLFFFYIWPLLVLGIMVYVFLKLKSRK